MFCKALFLVLRIPPDFIFAEHFIVTRNDFIMHALW